MIPENAIPQIIAGEKGLLRVEPFHIYSELTPEETDALDKISARAIDKYKSYIEENRWNHTPMFVYHGVFIDRETLESSRKESGYEYFQENHASCLKEDGPMMSFSCSHIEDDFRVIHVWNYIEKEQIISLALSL